MIRLFLLFFLFLVPLLRGEQAVTYDLGGGRFGDQFISYLHAKWISYRYGIPLLYKPFLYSDELALHYMETPYESADLSKYSTVLCPSYKMNVDYEDPSSTLYIIPYFPDCLHEHRPEERWYYFPVDWEDKGFKDLLKSLIKPAFEFSPQVELPQDRISVAVHVRKGGGFDSPSTWKGAPLKLPPESFYIEQIKKIYEILGHKPLYVYIFTDDRNPLAIVKRYKKKMQDRDIQFDCRAKGNHHSTNVLQDFFEMTKFDCLIRPDSNYSIVASKIADYKILIHPIHFKWTGKNEGYVDKVEIIMR